MKYIPIKIEALTDYFLIGFVILLIGLITYHPFFFGDELVVWGAAEKHVDDFIGSLLEYCKYKPRFIFNSIWLLIPNFELSRLWAMLFMLAGEIVCAISIYTLSIKIKQDRLIAWLAVAAFVSSRFGIVIWYDYLSGVIETLSFAFFILSVIAISNYKETNNQKLLLIALVLFLSTVFTHERYIPAVLIIGVYVALTYKISVSNRLKILSIAAIPAAGFYLANMLYGKQSIATGTAGMAVAIDYETAFAYLTYLSNILFQTNFGHDWFVGNINLNYKSGKVAAVLSTLSFSLFYFHRFKSGRAVENHKHILLLCILSCLALIAVASLPGLGRQESRWMYPVFGLFIIICVILFTNKALINFLSLVIIFNLFYIFSGSINPIYNIYASRIAQNVGMSLKNFQPTGKRGIFLWEKDLDWVLGAGSKSGHLFSIANKLNGNIIDIQPINESLLDPIYEYSVIRSGKAKNGAPIFKQISLQESRLLLNPALKLSEVGLAENILGQINSWNNWRIPENMNLSGEILLTENNASFVEAPAGSVDGKLLIYTAKTLSSESIPMRIQINWINKKNEFVASSIKVVDVGPQTNDHISLFFAPEGSVKALIYASLHNNTKDRIILQKVSIAEKKAF